CSRMRTFDRGRDFSPGVVLSSMGTTYTGRFSMRRWIAVPLVFGSLLWAASVASAATPAVFTNSASAISNTKATLNGTVKAGGQPTGYAFQYGLSSAYTKQTPAHSAGSGFTNLKVSAAIARLIPGTVYHFRV